MSGPLFLLGYAALAIAANLWLRSRIRAREAGKQGPFMEIAQDPYQVAFLRNGAAEAVHLAVFSLVDRGLLEETGGTVRRARTDAQSFARRPIEQAVLGCCAGWTSVADIDKNFRVEAACLAYQDALAKAQLLADANVYSERFALFAATLALLLGVAGARIAWALSQGRHNIGFLIALAVIAGIALIVGWRRRRTGLGDATLDRLKILFAKLKARAAALAPGGASHDAVLTAAVFGLAALPSGSFPYLGRLFPAPKSSDSGSGSDGGDSGGGGCGGGGCGGGCGG